MQLNEYQKAAQKTSGAYGKGISKRRQLLSVLALAGEIGELCNKLKKREAHGHSISDGDLGEELGDILWYVAEVATALGFDLEDIGLMNLLKLQKRYGEGFDQDKSRNRKV